MSRQYPNKPVFGVGAVIVRDEAVVLVKRGREPLKGKWSLPGGAQELGETAMEAVVREVREETGLEVKPQRLIAVVDIIDRDEDGLVRHHYTVADYACEVVGGALKAGGDAAEARWVEKDNLGNFELTPKARDVIEAAWKS